MLEIVLLPFIGLDLEESPDHVRLSIFVPIKLLFALRHGFCRGETEMSEEFHCFPNGGNEEDGKNHVKRHQVRWQSPTNSEKCQRRRNFLYPAAVFHAITCKVPGAAIKKPAEYLMNISDQVSPVPAYTLVNAELKTNSYILIRNRKSTIDFCFANLRTVSHHSSVQESITPSDSRILDIEYTLLTMRRRSACSCSSRVGK